MKLTLTDKAIENIETAKSEWLKSKSSHRGEGINIRNDIFREAVVYRNDTYLFKVSEMWAVVNELNAMVEIIKDTIGVYEEV